MSFEVFENILVWHKRFQELDYQKRVIFFDQHFSIFPFEFPFFDIEASWYNNEIKSTSFLNIFHNETRNKNLYEKIFSVQDQQYKFDIRPLSLLDRIYLNHFILSRFLEAKEVILQNLLADLDNAENPLKFLEARIHQLNSIVEWAKHIHQSSHNLSLRVKLLGIFLNGYNAFHFGNENRITNRRKYIELFLYAQGLMLAEHLTELQKRLENKKNEENQPYSLSLPLKIVLMEQLGILQLLKTNFETNKGRSDSMQLSQLISLITSENPKNHESILKYISALGTGTNKDLLNKKNLDLINHELARLQI
jgi:hypothetical protein